MRLSTRNMRLASSVILSAFTLFMKDNEFGTLLNFAERLPKKYITQNVTLTCIFAHAANATGHIQMAERLIQDAEKYIGVTIDEFIIQGENLGLSSLAKAGLIELGVIKSTARA